MCMATPVMERASYLPKFEKLAPGWAPADHIMFGANAALTILVIVFASRVGHATAYLALHLVIAGCVMASAHYANASKSGGSVPTRGGNS